MIASTIPHRRSLVFAATTLLAFAFSGCKSNQATSSPASPAAAPTAAERQPVTPPPAVKKHLYSAEADPKADIAAALKQARLEHKRVILDFGGDWCGDCQVLDIYFHQPPNAELLDKNFLVVHVYIGHLDKNLDITEKYNVPLKRAFPLSPSSTPTASSSTRSRQAEFARHALHGRHLRHRLPQPVEGLDPPSVQCSPRSIDSR